MMLDVRTCRSASWVQSVHQLEGPANEVGALLIWQIFSCLQWRWLQNDDDDNEVDGHPVPAVADTSRANLEVPATIIGHSHPKLHNKIISIRSDQNFWAWSYKKHLELSDSGFLAKKLCAFFSTRSPLIRTTLIVGNINSNNSNNSAKPEKTKKG